mmetsp:Transcript_33727/g.89330  ORF Transcript_33727/g.89330 Transcript_33727/m.89330 type:complete len:212 (-) Transcript_33727:30-665(-)
MAMVAGASVAAAVSATRSMRSSAAVEGRARQYLDLDDNDAVDRDAQSRLSMFRRMITTYDKDNSGDLNAGELAGLIKWYSDSKQWTMQPVNPTYKEMTWILQAADKRKLNAIDESHLQLALELWRSYISNRSWVETVFEKYGINKSDKLDFSQLKQYLTELNNGRPPQDSKVRAVMEEVNGADGVSRVQLSVAVDAWADAQSKRAGCCCVA